MVPSAVVHGGDDSEDVPAGDPAAISQCAKQGEQGGTSPCAGREGQAPTGGASQSVSSAAAAAPPAPEAGSPKKGVVVQQGGNQVKEAP
eukprot:COSAG01_NODE_8228_length_2865_cov_3.592914_6_plen_88_part_01